MGDLVSIITPMFNAKKYISDTIDSVLSQTYNNWEMIIVDDCSTDGCNEIVLEYCNKDNRIKYIKNENNCGVAESRNKAIKYANGKYIALLDSDDIWKSQKIEKQVTFMQDGDKEFSFCACEIIDSDGNAISKVRRAVSRVDYKELLKGNTIPCLTVMIDMSRIKKIEMPNIPHEDYVTWLNILRSGVVAYGLDEILASYRESNNSVSANKLKAMKWTWNIYRHELDLSFTSSIYYFANYIFNAYKKRY